MDIFPHELHADYLKAAKTDFNFKRKIHIFKDTDVHIMYMYVSGFIQSCYSCKQMKINCVTNVT